MSILTKWYSPIENRMQEAWRSQKDAKKPVYPIAVDIVENDTGYEISADLPGLEKKDVSITVQENLLTLSGGRERTAKAEDMEWTERFYGVFQRSFRLPRNIETSNIEATMNNGVLKISLKKQKAALPRQIEITEL